jgi:hypothetical protein
MARKGAQRRELAHERTALHPLGAARGEKRPDVEGFEADEVASGRRAAEMHGQKGQELAQVAAIGDERFWREPPLAGEPVEPGQRLAAGVRRAGHRERERRVLRSREGEGEAAAIPSPVPVLYRI